MRELEIKLTGVINLHPTILIDGKAAKVKKNEFGNYVCKHETEKEKVNIKIFRYLEIAGRLWWLTEIFFFLISLFGLLGPKLDKKCIVIDFEAEVDLNQTSKLELSLCNMQDKGKAIDIVSDGEIKEIANTYHIDQKAKRRLKILKFIKIAIFIAAIIALILILTNVLN